MEEEKAGSGYKWRAIDIKPLDRLLNPEAYVNEKQEGERPVATQSTVVWGF